MNYLYKHPNCSSILAFQFLCGNSRKVVPWKSCIISCGCGLTSSTSSSFFSSYTVACVLLVLVRYGRSRVDLPPLVVMALTFSRLVAKGRAVTSWANYESIFLLYLSWSLMAEEKLSILIFIFSKTLSLEACFLEIFSLILASSKIKFLKYG